MASHWGRVTPQGVCIPFHLTHEVLGEIIGARRPSVSVAMASLQRRNEIARRSDGCYVLTGDVDRLAAKITQLLEGKADESTEVDQQNQPRTPGTSRRSVRS